MSRGGETELPILVEQLLEEYPGLSPDRADAALRLTKQNGHYSLYRAAAVLPGVEGAPLELSDVSSVERSEEQVNSGGSTSDVIPLRATLYDGPKTWLTNNPANCKADDSPCSGLEVTSFVSYSVQSGAHYSAVQVTAATLLAWVRRHTSAVSFSPLWPGSSVLPPVVGSECYVAALGGVDISANSACFFQAVRPLATAGLRVLADATETCGVTSVSSFVSCTLPAVWSAATYTWVNGAMGLLNGVAVDKPSGSFSSSSGAEAKAEEAVSAVLKAPAYFALGLSFSSLLTDSTYEWLQGIVDRLQVDQIGATLTSMTLGSSPIGGASFHLRSWSDLDGADGSESFSTQSGNAGSAWTALQRVACAALTTKSCADGLYKRGGADTLGALGPSPRSAACSAVAAQMPPLLAVARVQHVQRLID